jgi:hypothetical protein
MRMYRSDGSRGMHYLYDYSGDSYSKTGFDDKNKINTKYVWKLDKDGREIARTDVDVRNVSGSDKTFLLTYQSFDSVGNWTQRTLVEPTSAKDGKQTQRSIYTEYRIITYY